MLFDTGQPYAVIERSSSGFNLVDFLPDRDCTQVFLSWELPIRNVSVGRALGIAYDIDSLTSLLLDEMQSGGAAQGPACAWILVDGATMNYLAAP